jgi:MFS family permease
VLGQFSCDEYYKTHSSDAPYETRCNIPAIEARTARELALLGASTTIFGVCNLFFTGWMIKRFGIKSALIASVFWPAVRVFIQAVGTEVGAGRGIIIIQLSQIITILGGPSGYRLALNSYAAEIVEPKQRTATLGRLSGGPMIGSSIGFLMGGLISDGVGLKTPFHVAFVLFLLSCLFILTFLPSVEAEVPAQERKKVTSLSAFLAPFKLYIPSKWVAVDGRRHMEFGVLLLGLGAFLGVLATGYIPLLLQLFSMDVLHFRPRDNGWLISLNCAVRGIFLTFIFPSIIALGRKWIDKESERSDLPEPVEAPEPAVDLSLSSTVPPPAEVISQPTALQTPLVTATREGPFHFDLLFVTWSILLDGILTGLATFITQGWQLYLLAVILPLASGTGPAAKGTIIQMCTPSQRVDALSAISLVEQMANLITVGVFGGLFAAFAAMGKPELTFLCNAGVAVLAFIVLIFARYPPVGSRRLAELEESESMEQQ